MTLVRENIEFKRGRDPKKALGLGSIPIIHVKHFFIGGNLLEIPDIIDDKYEMIDISGNPFDIYLMSKNIDINKYDFPNKDLIGQAIIGWNNELINWNTIDQDVEDTMIIFELSDPELDEIWPISEWIAFLPETNTVSKVIDERSLWNPQLL